MPKTAMMGKNIELDILTQGALSLNEYEQKFRELIQYLSYRPDETRKCRMFEKGLKDEISVSVASGMHATYAKCMVSARSAEMMLARQKTKEVTPKVKVEDAVRDVTAKPWQKNANNKRPFDKGNNSGKQADNKGQPWKKGRNDNAKIMGYCYNYWKKGHRATDYRSAKVEKPKDLETGGQRQWKTDGQNRNQLWSQANQL
jgi:hypothetical protein